MFMDLVDLRAVWPERAEQDWGGEEPAGNSHEYTVIGGQGQKYLYGGWDHYIVDVSAFNRSVHGSHLSYVIRNQRKAVEGFRCLSSIELSLYGTRELALARLSISDQDWPSLILWRWCGITKWPGDWSVSRTRTSELRPPNPLPSPTSSLFSPLSFFELHMFLMLILLSLF